MAKSEALAAVSAVVRASNRIPIATAYLHQAVIIPGSGMVEKHLGKPTQGLTLEWGPEGLWITQTNGKPTMIVPQANVSGVVLK